MRACIAVVHPSGNAHSRSPLTDARVAAATVAFLQQAQAVAQSPRQGMVFTGERTAGQTGQLLSAFSGISQACISADISQHRPGFHRGKLVAIAQENDAGVRWLRLGKGQAAPR